jgi:hypothetical protein
MTCERLCGPQRQPCPSPYLCRTDCYFQTAEQAYDKAAQQHFATALPVTMFDKPAWHVQALDWIGNKADLVADFCRAAKYWVSSALRDAVDVLPSVLWALCAVLACMLTAVVVVGYVK